MTDEKFFTTEQVAAMFEVSPRTVLRWIERGDLYGERLSRKVTRIPEWAIRDLRRRSAPNPETSHA